jgi:hypothetical protein
MALSESRQDYPEEDAVAPSYTPERRLGRTPMQVVRVALVVAFDRRAEDHVQEKDTVKAVALTSIATIPTADFLQIKKAEFDRTATPGEIIDMQTGVIYRHRGSDEEKVVYLSGNINDIVNNIRAETEVAYHVQPKPELTPQRVAHTVFSAFSANPYYLAVGTSR